VKAYGDTAKAVIAAASWEELRVWVAARVTVDWAEHRPLKAELAARGARVDTEEFGAGVTLVARIPGEAFEGLQTFTVDLTRGRCRWTRLEGS
jgi:putative IMPACT (imprinted ancient) family translation regulator